MKEWFDNDSWSTNSGHFDLVVENWKRLGGTFEDLLSLLKTHKDKHIKTLAEHWQHDMKTFYPKTVLGYAARGDREFTETSVNHAKTNLADLNMFRRELGQPPLPEPEYLTWNIDKLMDRALEEEFKRIDDEQSERKEQLRLKILKRREAEQEEKTVDEFTRKLLG